MHVDVDVNNLDFAEYYHSENKELNLSNIPLGDDNLVSLEPKLKQFINHIGVERLLIENAQLETVPYTLIGFALICKPLKYASFLGNNFALHTSVCSSDATEETRPRANSLLEEAVSTVWGNISPEIEKAISAHNSNGSKFKYYNKIIVIDKGIPPVTILDSYRKPYSKIERVKYVSVRLGFLGFGMIITALPSIIPWLVQFLGGNEDNVSSSSMFNSTGL